MYQAIICDLDGTLLNSSHTISNHTREVINAVQKKGIFISIATGRLYKDAAAYQRLLGLDSFLISSNGANIHNENGNNIYSNNIPFETVEDLITLPIDPEIIPHIYQSGHWYCERPEIVDLKAYAVSGITPEDKPFHLIEGDITKLCYKCNKSSQKLTDLYQILRQKFGKKVSVSFSSPMFLEVMNHGVSKGKALEKILKYQNLQSESTLVFGDAPNDYEMLNMAGKGILMGNCNDALRKALPNHEIIDTNDNDGVAKYLEKTYL